MSGSSSRTGRLKPIDGLSAAEQNPAELGKPVSRIDMNYVNNFLFVPPERVSEFTSKITAALREFQPPKAIAA